MNFQFLFISEFLNFSIFENGFDGYRILGLQLFFYPFSTLSRSFYCLLASMVSDEKSVINVIEDAFYVMSCPSLTAYSLIIIRLGVDVFESILVRVEVLECVD